MSNFFCWCSISVSNCSIYQPKNWFLIQFFFCLNYFWGKIIMATSTRTLPICHRPSICKSLILIIMKPFQKFFSPQKKTGPGWDFVTFRFYSKHNQIFRIQFILYLDPHFLCWILEVVPFNTWLISACNNSYFLLSLRSVTC